MISNQQIAENEAALLRLVRTRAGCTRIELARELGLSPSTVSTYVDRLTGEGYLREGPVIRPAERGRPATRIDLNPAGGCFLGLDVTRRMLRAVVLDFAETVSCSRDARIPLDAGLAEVLSELLHLAGECRTAADRRLLGMGLALPAALRGPAAARTGCPHLRDWDMDHVRTTFEEHFGLPLRTEPEIRAMAAAELWLGHGRTIDPFVCLSVRTGVGAVPVIGGEPVAGADGLAGDIGRWVPPATAPASLAEVASMPGLLGRLSAARQPGEAALCPELAFGEIVDAYRHNDEVVAEHVDAAALALGWASARLCELLNPALLVLAGPLNLLGPRFADGIATALNEHLAPGEAPSLAASHLDSFAAAIGAAAVGLHYWRPER